MKHPKQQEIMDVCGIGTCPVVKHFTKLHIAGRDTCEIHLYLLSTYCYCFKILTLLCQAPNRWLHSKDGCGNNNIIKQGAMQILVADLPTAVGCKICLIESNVFSKRSAVFTNLNSLP
jgi:hypothetical protein